MSTLYHKSHEHVTASDLEFWKGQFPWDNLIQSANREVFGNLKLRDFQREAVNANLAGLDVFLNLPTGL